ncbi:MAG: 50S ribosomal protein L24e [Candidatus Methanofastidiosia archaeon]
MPRRVICSFCGMQIEPGRGTMYVQKDGTVLNFCSNKCEKNMLVLKRKPRTTRWTQKYKEEKEQRLKQ